MNTQKFLNSIASLDPQFVRMTRRAFLKFSATLGMPAAGFTLIELLVVVLIIGILAAIAVPQYFRVVEKGRFAEATALFQTMKGTQERYLLKQNTYAGSTANLDVAPPTTKYFGAITLTATASAYTVGITRAAPTPGTYGAYTVSYVGPGGTISCSNASCTSDLAP